MVKPTNLLILGGTGEAAALAQHAVARPGLRVTTSLAGGTRNPAPIVGAVRSGGFGGADGMTDYLRQAGVDLVVDATHPFAAVISRNAAQACRAVGLARLHLVRPQWDSQQGDTWIEVDDMARAAASVAGRRAFLTIGLGEIGRFAEIQDAWFLVRVIETPAGPPPLADCRVVVGRPPFTIDDERALMSDHRIDVVVSKNSGGAATYAKIAAARALGLPVVMVRRPAPPRGPVVATVEEAVSWIADQGARRGRRRWA